MASDDDSSGGGDEVSGPSAAEAGEGPAYPHHRDPVVETVLLGQRPPARRRLPRVSTMLLVAAFVGVFALYLTLRPGG